MYRGFIMNLFGRRLLRSLFNREKLRLHERFGGSFGVDIDILLLMLGVLLLLFRNDFDLLLNIIDLLFYCGTDLFFFLFSVFPHAIFFLTRL
jgi:hypothetical protein